MVHQQGLLLIHQDLVRAQGLPRQVLLRMGGGLYSVINAVDGGMLPENAQTRKT